MTKIQIIIDDGQSFQVLTCSGGLEIEQTQSEYDVYRGYHRSDTAPFCFKTDIVVKDDSPNLISIPDELLLRIRDYNIGTEHLHTIKKTNKLKKKNKGLKWLIENHKRELSELEREVERFHEVLEGMIDRYPMAAAELCLQDGNLDAACYFAQKANEEESENV